MNATATTLTLTNDLLTGMEWGPAQVRELFHLAADIKARPDRYRGALEGKFLAMFFEKPSLRTRLTFEAGICGLGGDRLPSSIIRHERLERVKPWPTSPTISNAG